MPNACANCAGSISSSESARTLQCDGCKRSIHLACTDVSSEDRVTRHKIRGLKILCNKCSTNMDNFNDIKKLLEDFKNEFKKEFINDMDIVKDKIDALTRKLENIDNLSSVQFTDKIANEAVDRINRAKNVFIRGVPEADGDINTRKESDKKIVETVLTTVNCNTKPVATFRIGKSNSKYPRMIKVVMNNEFEARQILRNKKKLLETNCTKNISVIDDKTPVQVQCLKELREELDMRKRKGEPNLTIKYIHGCPKIVNFRQ